MSWQARRPVNNWLRNHLLARLRQLQAVWRSLIVSGQELWLFVKFVVTRNRRSFWLGSCLSNVSFVKSHKISRSVPWLWWIDLLLLIVLDYRPIFVSNHRLWWLSRKLQRLTLSRCSKTRILLLSTLSVSLSNLKILHLLGGWEESDHRSSCSSSRMYRCNLFVPHFLIL